MKPSHLALLNAAVVATIMTGLIGWGLQYLFDVWLTDHLRITTVMWMVFLLMAFPQQIQYSVLDHIDRDWERTKK